MSAVGAPDVVVDVRVEADRLLVAVRGDLDLEAAAILRAIIRGLFDDGHMTITVDLADVSFMGAAGLGVVAEAAGRVRASGGTLHIRSAAPLTLRVLQITGIDALVRLETRDRGVAALGAEERADQSPVTIGEERVEVVADLVKVGSMITANALVDRALQLVTVLAKAAIDGADGVSVSLERHDRISTVAWSNDTVLQMDLHQYQTGEGPCLDAATTGRWFHIDSLADEDRWPAFVPRARKEGIASVLSTPLKTPERSVGALNIYSNNESVFGKAELDLAGLFAEQASGIVAASLTEQHAGARLAQALVDREVIAQAQGVLMARGGSSTVEAAADLFRAARAAQLTLSRLAANVVSSTRRAAGPTIGGAHVE